MSQSDRPVSTLTSALLAVALIGLSSVPVRAEDDDTPNNSYADKMGDIIGGGVKRVEGFVGMGKVPPPPPRASPSGCPEITVLDGTGAQRIMAANAVGNAGLRLQYSITDVARECHLSNNQMVVKVGVEGRVLLGPAGAPGAFDVPIRVAIVNRIDERPFLSKLYRVPASIPTGQTAAPYALVADSLVIPFAAGRTAQDYSIKIGIDSAAKGGSEVAAKPSRHRKPKPIAAASQ